MNHLKKIKLCLALATMMLVNASQFAVAQELSKEPLGVVELFTSQGCSSCPPADKTLSRLIKDGDVIALSYHVDYWNYLGWEDTLSLKSATDRQYSYAKSFNRRGVYTPQAVLNGRDHLVGGQYEEIKSRLSSYDKSRKGLRVPITVSKSGDEMKISVGKGRGKADVVIVYFDKENTVNITRGENSGKQMTYHNSVRDIQTIGMWNGKAQDFILPASMLNKLKTGGCAILLQSTTRNGNPSAILGAATYQL